MKKEQLFSKKRTLEKELFLGFVVCAFLFVVFVFFL
jgi:hypothetical protein